MADRESGIWVPPGGSADPPRSEQAPPPPPPEDSITPEELAEQLRRIRVSDVVLSLLPTLAQLGYAKLDPETRDLDEARVAIDTLRALLPVLEGAVAEELTRDYRQVVTNMQLAYASAADETAKGAAPVGEPARARESAPAEESAEQEGEAVSAARDGASDSLLQDGEGQAAAPAAEERASANVESGQDEGGAAAEDSAAEESAEG